MPVDLKNLADELALRFPEARPILPLEALGSGFESVVIETASGAVFKVARDAATGVRFRLEIALLDELAGVVSLPVPVPRWQAFDLPNAPHGVSGYRKLPGAPLEPALLTGVPARRLGEQIAQFLVSLHDLQPAALTTPLPTLDPDALLTPDVCSLAREAIVPRATEHDLRALDEWFARGVAQPDPRQLVVTHGDFWYENLLVVPGPVLSGVLDWGHAAFSAPARDLAPLAYNGDEFLASVAHAYADARGLDAAALIDQAGDFLLFRELTGLHWAANHDETELPDAIDKVVSLLRARSRFKTRAKRAD